MPTQRKTAQQQFSRKNLFWTVYFTLSIEDASLAFIKTFKQILNIKQSLTDMVNKYFNFNERVRTLH